MRRRTSRTHASSVRSSGAGSTTRRKPVTTVAVVDDAEIVAACARLRRELADRLPTLTDAQLATPSLCAGWTVREVAGHLTEAVTGRLPAGRIPARSR